MSHCVCGHPEEAHLFGGRCRVPGCVCERFWPIPEISDGGAGLLGTPLPRPSPGTSTKRRDRPHSLRVTVPIERATVARPDPSGLVAAK